MYKSSKIDITNLLNPNKFIPIYLERKNMNFSLLPPVAVEFHLTATCNYNCYHCSYGLRNKKRIFLPESVIELLIENLINMKIKCVYFSGGGEPTTLKNWSKYMNRLLNSNIDISLITNAALIKDEHLSLIRRINYIAISIYSTHEDIYKKITGGNNFATYFSLPKKIKAEPHRCIVGARCVINKFNYQDILNLYLRAIEVGYDYIIFIPAIDYEKRGVVLTKDQIEFLKNMVETNVDKIDNKNTNLFNLYKKNFSYYKVDKSYKMGCQAVLLRTNTFINYDGGVWLCQPLIGQEEYCIGNLYNNSFSEIWNSDRHLQVIDKLSERFKRGECYDCRSIAFNESVFRFEDSLNEPFIIVRDYFI